jgi:GT2 family glycosyltransferase
MKLLVIICNYRVTDLTIDCLRSLEGRIQRVPNSRAAVVENGTGPADAERLRSAIATNGWGWADLTVVYPNRGFTGGNNVVLRPALDSADPPEYVLLLNADTVVLDGALEALVDFMDAHPRAGAAGGALVYPDGEVYGPPFRFLRIATELDRGLRLGFVTRALRRWTIPVRPRPTDACPAEWVSGANIILRASMLRDIGLLDEGLYTYFDDVDLCLRAKRAGWETWYVPESRIVHFEGKSTGIVAQSPNRRPAYWFQARRRFFLKNYGAAYTAAADALFITGFALWRLRRWLLRRPDTDPPHMLLDSIRNSVFLTGFEVTEVENPAMPRNAR